MKQTDFTLLRQHMVDSQLVQRNIVNKSVLSAMRSVPRHCFVPAALREQSYEDYPLPIGYSQTISQPYIVAYMAQLIDPEPGQCILEIGTGSGYMAAVLARLVSSVYTIEIIPELHMRAAGVFDELRITNIHSVLRNGREGCPESAPFDAVIVSAAAPHIPPALVAQLKTGGRLCAPVGLAQGAQRLCVLRKFSGNQTSYTELDFVRFVPLCGSTDERSV